VPEVRRPQIFIQLRQAAVNDPKVAAENTLGSAGLLFHMC